MKISIIMPAYNEEKRIGKALEAYSKFFGTLSKKERLDYEIIVVINNTTDRTEEIVNKHKKKNKKIRYLNLKRGGKGYAITEGFKDSLKRKSDLIGFVDADLATPPQAFYFLIRKLNNNDGIIASRYIQGSIIKPKPSFSRYVSSRVYNFLIRSLFLIPYRDTQCGAKVFKRQAIKKIVNLLSFSKWAFDIDLIYTLRNNGFKIGEAPTIWSDKGYSKINFLKAGPMMVLGAIRLRIINSIFKRFIKIYDKLIFTLIWRKKQAKI